MTRKPSTSPSVRLALGAAMAALGVWACEGENAFAPRLVGPPQIIALVAPAEVRAGQSIDVRVTAVGEARIDSVAVRFRRAFETSVGRSVSPPSQTAVVDLSAQVPTEIADTLLIVTAVVRDVTGNLSAVKADTVKVIDTTAPTVTITLAKSPVGLGKPASFTITATDNVALRSLGYVLTGAKKDTLKIEAVQVSGQKAQRVFFFDVPEDFTPQQLTIQAFAVDVTANSVRAQAVQVVEDDKPPLVDIRSPAPLSGSPVGDSLLVQALVHDKGGVSQVSLVGLANRGDPTLGTDTVVTRYASRSVAFTKLPIDTLIQRFLFPVADTTSELVNIVVSAVDSAGNAGVDTVRILIGGPKVFLVNVESGQTVRAGQPLSLRVQASDPQRLVSVTLRATGAVDTTLTRAFITPPLEVTLDTTLVVPAGSTGQFTLVASARNTLGVAGESESVIVTIVSPLALDTVPPLLALSVRAASRLEFTDSVRVEITGRDDNQGRGVAKVGYTVRGISPLRGDTLVRADSVTFSPPLTGTVIRNFAFAPFNVDSLSLPDTLVYEVTGWMIDGDGNCSASVTSGVLTRVACDTLPTGQRVGKNVVGQRVTIAVVSGRTVLLPRGGLISDAVVDTTRKLLVLSNIDQDRLEVFDLGTQLFGTAIRVGSKPWGMDFRVACGAAGCQITDTLLVGNSGGTNISYVNLNSRLEIVSRRLLTPNIGLFEIDGQVSETGFVKYTSTFIQFSDRPQFLAVDSTGAVIFSTKPTPSARLGTIRSVRDSATWEQPEATLFFEHARPVASPTTTTVAAIDLVAIAPGGGTADDKVTLIDHKNGFPNNILSAGPDSLNGAIAGLQAQNSDIKVRSGKLDIEQIGLRDTTFVSASGDHGWVVFGEGAAGPTGRIILYNAAQKRISDFISVVDLTGNASERVFGVALNHDGSLGAARGTQAYFFTADPLRLELRLQGSEVPLQGGAGAALHPLHARAVTTTGFAVYEPNTHLAFFGTGQNTIDIVDTFHFGRLGRLYIRDRVSGPMRATLPFAADNAGLTCAATVSVQNRSGTVIGQAIRLFTDANGQVPDTTNDDRCIVLKLYGVTSAGGVVVVDVRKADILRDHPALAP